MKKLLHLHLHRSWSILLHTVSGASRSVFIFLSGFLVLATGLSPAQSQDDLNAELQLQAKPQFQQLPTGEKIFNWTGQSDFTYFVQASPNLLDWTWAPNIEPGIDGPMSYEVDGPTAAGFFRLIRTDQTAEDPDAADFDGDGYSNLYELTPRPRPGGVPIGVNISPNIQTSPLRKDTDGDGLDDKWEEEHGLDPTDDGSRDINNGPNGDPDGDGVTNLEEQRLGTDPHGNATTTDSDGDGVLDVDDAMPGYNLVSWQRAPECGYALIEIVAPSSVGLAKDLNDKGDVLFSNGIWSGGSWEPRLAQDATGADPDDTPYEVAFTGWTHFNQNKKLLGKSFLHYTEGPGLDGGLDSPAFWPVGQSSPTLFLDSADLWEDFPNQYWPIGVCTDGGMVVRVGPRSINFETINRYTSGGVLISQMDGTNGFHPDGTEGHSDISPSGWVASNLVRPPNSTQSAAYKVGLWDASSNPITLPAEANGWGYPVSVRDLPNNKIALTAGQWSGANHSGRVFLKNPTTGQFEYASNLGDKKIELFAGNGTALTSDNKLWRNGELTPMADLCARYKELLTDNTILPLRSNQDGTYLVQVESKSAGSPVVSSALLVPIELRWQAIAGFENVDDHIDPWTPGKKNGQRIFPDYKNPADTEIRHKLELVVKTSPSLVGKVVWVKAFDVDDSTSEFFDKDPETSTPVVDPNGKAGDDNLIDCLGTPQSGQFWNGSAWVGDTAQGTVDANGEAKFIFRVGMQPGNNYRVAASLIDQSMYAGVQTANATAAKYLGAEAAETGGAYASPLLTVWRRLWVENDSMAAIPTDSFGYKRNDLSADLDPAAIASSSLDSGGASTSFGIPAISDQSSFLTLENGHIIIQSDFYPVADTHSFSVTVAGDHTSIPNHSEFRLYDDDGFGLSSAPLPRNDLASDEMKKVFRPAFVEIEDAKDYNPRKSIDFWRNYAPYINYYGDPGIWDDTTDIEDSNELWVGNLKIGYQGFGESDGDPNSEGRLLGVTPTNRQFSIVYIETVRDEADDGFRTYPSLMPMLINKHELNIILTASHELAHMPGGGSEESHHNEGWLMAAGGTNEGFEFNIRTISRFRGTHKWQQP